MPEGIQLAPKNLNRKDTFRCHIIAQIRTQDTITTFHPSLRSHLLSLRPLTPQSLWWANGIRYKCLQMELKMALAMAFFLLTIMIFTSHCIYDLNIFFYNEQNIRFYGIGVPNRIFHNANWYR